MKKIIVSLAALLWLPAAFAAQGTFPVEEDFLSVSLDQMNIVREEEGGIDLIYKPPGLYERLAKYDKIMIDQPEIWIDPDSKYRGTKPDNIKAIADLLRENLTAKVIDRGYEVVDEPGPGVLYIRTAMTDLYLKKKKRGILAYTPAGAVAKLGVDAIRDMMKKIDIIEAAIPLKRCSARSSSNVAPARTRRPARNSRATTSASSGSKCSTTVAAWRVASTTRGLRRLSRSIVRRWMHSSMPTTWSCRIGTIRRIIVIEPRRD